MSKAQRVSAISAADGIRLDLDEAAKELSHFFQTYVSEPELLRSAGLAVISPLGAYAWHIPTQAGRLARKSVLDALVTLRLEAVSILKRASIDREVKEITYGLDAVIECLETQQTESSSTSKLVTASLNQLAEFNVAFQQTLPPSPVEPLYVVDTNSLMDDPAIENWQLSGPKPWHYVIVPEVVREVDRLKSRPQTRDVAIRITNQLKEYGRRGAFGGTRAVLVNGSSYIEVLPIDPDFSELPGWLRSDNGDDRILASALLIAWQRPRTAICVVTGDVNVMNKARLVGLACEER